MIPGTGTGAGRWGWLSPDLGNALSFELSFIAHVGLRWFFAWLLACEQTN